MPGNGFRCRSTTRPLIVRKGRSIIGSRTRGFSTDRHPGRQDRLHSVRDHDTVQRPDQQVVRRLERTVSRCAEWPVFEVDRVGFQGSALEPDLDKLARDGLSRTISDTADQPARRLETDRDRRSCDSLPGRSINGIDCVPIASAVISNGDHLAVGSEVGEAGRAIRPGADGAGSASNSGMSAIVRGGKNSVRTEILAPATGSSPGPTTFTVFGAALCKTTAGGKRSPGAAVNAKPGLKTHTYTPPRMPDPADGVASRYRPSASVFVCTTKGPESPSEGAGAWSTTWASATGFPWPSMTVPSSALPEIEPSGPRRGSVRKALSSNQFPGRSQ